MLYVFNLFGPYWQKGEKHMSLIVFKRVHMGGCFIFCLMFTTLVLIHLVLRVVTPKLDGRLLLICYFVMRWQIPHLDHFADVHFPLCMSLSSHTFTCIMNCHHKLKRISTSTTCHVHLHSKSKLLICTSSGGALATNEDNSLSFTISHIIFPVENFN